MIFARKMSEFYIKIARKNLFPDFKGHVRPPPVSYAYATSVDVERVNRSSNCMARYLTQSSLRHESQYLNNIDLTELKFMILI